MTPEIVLATSQLRGLLELIRDKVLGWALDLADAGSRGRDELYPQEQQQAQQLAPVNIHIGGMRPVFSSCRARRAASNSRQ